MKKLNLNTVAEEFEMIDAETEVFYNTETGEFDSHNELIGLDGEDSEKFEDDCWIAAPSQRDINEYGIMVGFTDTVTDPRKNELLCVALESRGAFRRFKDTLQRVGLTEQWYTFRHNAYVELAREWCEENEIPYEGYTKPNESEPPQPSERACPVEFIIIPLVQKIADDAAEVLCEALNYSRQDAATEIKRMLSLM